MLLFSSSFCPFSKVICVISWLVNWCSISLHCTSSQLSIQLVAKLCNNVNIFFAFWKQILSFSSSICASTCAITRYWWHLYPSKIIANLCQARFAMRTLLISMEGGDSSGQRFQATHSHKHTCYTCYTCYRLLHKGTHLKRFFAIAMIWTVTYCRQFGQLLQQSLNHSYVRAEIVVILSYFILSLSYYNRSDLRLGKLKLYKLLFLICWVVDFPTQLDFHPLVFVFVSCTSWQIFKYQSYKYEKIQQENLLDVEQQWGWYQKELQMTFSCCGTVADCHLVLQCLFSFLFFCFK